MGETLRHRQTKEAATDMFSLKPPRHIPTLPITTDCQCSRRVGFAPDTHPESGHRWSAAWGQQETSRPLPRPAPNCRFEAHHTWQSRVSFHALLLKKELEQRIADLGRNRL